MALVHLLTETDERFSSSSLRHQTMRPKDLKLQSSKELQLKSKVDGGKTLIASCKLQKVTGDVT
jgi:hypothetical protein